MKSNRNRSQATSIMKKPRNHKTLGQPPIVQPRQKAREANGKRQRGWLVGSPIWPGEERSLGGGPPRARGSEGEASAVGEKKREGDSGLQGCEADKSPQASALEMLLLHNSFNASRQRSWIYRRQL